MTRVLSALVLLPVVIGTIWFLPPWGTLVLAAVAAVLAFVEFAALAGVKDPRLLTVSAAAVIGACLTVPVGSVEIILLSAFIACGAVIVSARQPGPAVLPEMASCVMAPVYLGLPLGALAAVRASAIGREGVLLLLAVIVISDSAQYYTGRAFGRRPLSPAISPKKTQEGAIGGVLFGTAAMVIGGRYVFGATAAWWELVLLGAAISLLGIVGDLFESLLKRSVGVKDSSHLIPGHGGVLDRIDSWLFAAPVYYVFVRFIA